MVIRHNEHLGLLIGMNQINKSIFNFVLEEHNGVLTSFIGDIYDMRIVDCEGNTLFLEDIKKDS